MGSKKKPGPGNPGREGELESESGVELDERPKTKKPRRYVVLLLNDDYTTMEFVVLVLMKFFHKDETQSTAIMLQVHHKGYGVVGAYTRDVAETKVEQVHAFARQHGHPLKASAEPEGERE